MSLLLLLSACELYRGPWGAWALHGDGEVTPLGVDDLPAAIDDGAIVTRDQADAAVPDWSLSATVGGEALFGTWDPDTESLTWRDLDAVVRHTVDDVALRATSRDSVLQYVRTGVDTAGGLILVHPLPPEVGDDSTVRVHRESGGTWSWTDVPDALTLAWEVGQQYAVTAHGDQVAWASRDGPILIIDGVPSQPPIVLDGATDLLFAADGTLVQFGRRFEDWLLYLVYDSCRVAFHDDDGEGALVQAADGSVELFWSDRFDRTARHPLLDDCALGDASVTWTTPYARSRTPPVRFGEALVWATPIDQDPTYHHDDTLENENDLAVSDYEWHLTRFEDD